MSHPDWTAVIWDLDGTIVDSGTEITGRFTRTLEILGWPVPAPEVLARLIGPPVTTGFIEVLGMPPELAAEGQRVMRSLVDLAHIAETSTPFDGVLELMAEIHAAGLPQAVASSKGQQLVAAIAEHLGLIPLLGACVGADESVGRATKESVIAEALAQLLAQGADLSRPVMVGDRVHDIIGAAAHGIPTVLVGWGYDHDDDDTAGALAHAQTAQELRALLLGRPVPTGV
ncbi:MULTISPECIES: HAD hydrolase-like protein [unclassified Leucobacter]|uniref:HAD hydrolase-like protein n=1 Tax=unclassified Leucobacter TaxID=2621730 RepID=UPI00165D9FF9|nr:MULTISPECIES: HAD hydrolase-like protein [unclassified Leucobacter]MBC9936181.1 HAD hydrolase-like protein [Leucobacter sp. cx-87]